MFRAVAESADDLADAITAVFAMAVTAAEDVVLEQRRQGNGAR
ncbi:hypothetical protein [Streptomyces sp. NBC_01589]